MQPLLQRLKSKIAPYQDIVIFVVTMLIANALWKAMIQGDEGACGSVTFLGAEVTGIFDAAVDHIKDRVYWLICLTRDTATLQGHRIRFATGASTSIVWSCTPIKQLFIWICLMVTSRGKWGHKLWFIPMGAVIIYYFNILRIYWINILIEFHQDWFMFLHNYLFKYLFYGVIFLLWFVWYKRYIEREESVGTVRTDTE